MRLKPLIKKVIDKYNFTTLDDYIDFSKRYLEYASQNLQAIIVSQNEHNYQFYQYKKEGYFNITRPINAQLMYGIEEFEGKIGSFLGVLNNIKNTKFDKNRYREVANNCVYTLQQSIGAALDALPAGKSNTARKINGDLFERLIQIILKRIGISCRAGIVKLPVRIDGEVAFHMRYQHDLVIEKDDQVKIIGSVKTSSKDRIDKIFIDKFLHNKLSKTDIPHIAIFLQDVQRKKTKSERKYGINSTFLPGHFKGYTLKLTPLDGVYYCDIRPNMLTEAILKDHIKRFDRLIFDDIWALL